MITLFRIYDGRTDLYQWDLDRKLIVGDKTIREVHFCNRTGECSLIRNVYEVNGMYLVDIPNVLLQTDWDIRVYGIDSNYTKHNQRFNVIARTRPENYVYTDTELKTWEQLESRIDEIEENGVSEEQIGEAVEKYLDENDIQVDVDLSEYYTKTEIEEKGYQTEEQVRAIVEEGSGEEVDLSNYYTKAETDKKIADAATGDVDLTGYYTKTETDTAIEQAVAAIEIPSTTGLATEKYVDDAIEAIDIPDITGLATEKYVDDAIEAIEISEPDLSEYAKKADIPDTTGFITSIPEEYITETELEEALANIPTGGGGGSADIDVFSPVIPEGSQLVSYKTDSTTEPVVDITSTFISEYNLQKNVDYYFTIVGQWGNMVNFGTTKSGSDLGYQKFKWNSDGTITVSSTGTYTGVKISSFYNSSGNYIAFRLVDASAGTEGLVPAPGLNDNNKFLCSDGKWKNNSPVSIGNNEIFNDSTTHSYLDNSGNNNNHIEGQKNTSTATSSQANHIEGFNNNFSGSYAYANHIEGRNNTVSGGTQGVHVEGGYHQVEANYGHAEGNGNKILTSSATHAHVEGSENTANKQDTHVEGSHNIASSAYQHVQGKYNIEDANGTYADIVGNGNSSARSNAYTLDWSGNATYAGTITSASGADYAEYFEWADGNPEGEDRVGYIVKLNGDKIEFANENDDVLGVISGTMTVLGDNAEWHWQGKYLTDDFGRIIYDLVEDYRTTIDDITGEEKTELVGTFPAPRINPDYDETKPYTNRKERAEWDAVGMMGKLYVRDDGTAQVNGYVVANNGIATATENRTNMRVMERINENIIRVCLK